MYNLSWAKGCDSFKQGLRLQASKFSSGQQKSKMLKKNLLVCYLVCGDGCSEAEFWWINDFTDLHRTMVILVFTGVTLLTSNLLINAGLEGNFYPCIAVVV